MMNFSAATDGVRERTHHAAIIRSLDKRCMEVLGEFFLLENSAGSSLTGRGHREIVSDVLAVFAIDVLDRLRLHG